MATATRPSPLRMLWITAALGTCFLGVRWGLRDAPLLWFAALRALLGGSALALVALAQHRPWPPARAWVRIASLGLVNVTVAFAAMFAGIAGLATGTAAVLANAQPLLILLPAWWLYGERLTSRSTAALAVGFGGLMVISVPGGGGGGALLSLLAAASVTLGTLMVRRLEGVDVVVASATHLLIGGLALAGVAYIVEGAPHIEWTLRFTAVLAFLGLVATAATTLAWFVETQRRPLGALTPWLFLVPVFGLLLGVVVLGERPGGWTIAGTALVLLSMRVALAHHPSVGAGPGPGPGPGHLPAIPLHARAIPATTCPTAPHLPLREPPLREPPLREPPAREPPAREPPAREPPAREPPAREPRARTTP